MSVISATASIDERIKWLRERNETFSELFCNPDQSGSRRLYRAKHPTAILASKCMDGRIHIPVMTEIPLGIITPLRSLGGYFDLGWPLLGEVMNDWVEYNVRHGNRCLVLVTYHYSKSSEHRGCAGFNYDTRSAHDFTWKFKEQIERVYGVGHSVVYPVIVGIETDEDAFTLISRKGEIKLIDCLNSSEAELKSMLEEHYPDMDAVVLSDLLPLVVGNISHVKAILANHRPVIEIEHKEWVLGLGRGFDWLHEPNLALIVGPYSPDLAEPIIKALGIIKSNMDNGKISDDGFVLLTSTPYRNSTGFEKTKAIEKAKFLSKFAFDVAKKHYPDMAEKMKQLTVILNENSRKFTEL